MSLSHSSFIEAKEFKDGKDGKDGKDTSIPQRALLPVLSDGKSYLADSLNTAPRPASVLSSLNSLHYSSIVM